LISDTECVCPAGFYHKGHALSSLAECLACSVECGEGTFLKGECDAHQDTQCQLCGDTCAAGYFMYQNCSRLADVECRRCSTGCLRGWYRVHECVDGQNLRCARCETVCSPGSVVTNPCGEKTNLECTPCPAGTFASTQQVCQACPDGFIAAEPGASSCVPCSNMTNMDQTRCFEHGCIAGYYPLTYTKCALCPPMTYGATGQGCISCVGGNFFSWGATACV
jgi:hypothetical protein